MVDKPENEALSKKLDFHLHNEDVDGGLEASGSQHKYQTIMILSFIFLKVVTDSFYAPLPYFLMDPKISCTNSTNTLKPQMNETASTYECSLSTVCMYNNHVDNIKKGRKINIHEKKDAKKTFINDFNLWCDYLKVGLLVGSASIGAIFTNIICPLLTENIGRNNTIRLTLICDICIKTGLFFVTNIYHIYTILLCINITNNLVFNTTYLYITEMVGKERRGVYLCFFNSLFGISGIMYTLLFNYTTSWRYLHGFSIGCAGMALLICLLLFRESVRYLHMKKRNDEVFETLEHIATTNERLAEYNSWKNDVIKKHTEEALLPKTAEEVKKDITQENSSVFSKLFTKSEDIWNFFVFTIISLVIISGIIFNAIDIKTSNNSLTYPIIFYSVDFVTIFLIGYIIDMPFFGRKKPAVLLSFLSSLLYLAKYVIQLSEGTNASIFGLDLACRVCVSLSFNILFAYNNEIYSTDIRSTAFNINKLFSHFGDFFTPLLMSYNRPLATLTLASMYFVMTLFLFTLRETMGKKLRESIYDAWEESAESDDKAGKESTPGNVLPESDTQNIKVAS